MDLIAVHLNECPHCRGEYQSLLDTKRLVASLAQRTSRAEIESLLKTDEGHRFMESGSGLFRGALRPKPLTATAVLSLAGLWIASASLDTPADGVSPGSGAISSPLSIATMPGLGAGMRSLRYLSDVVHNGHGSAALVPVNTDGLVMSPENSYPITVSGYGSRHRHPISLSNVLSGATGSRNPSPEGNGSTYSGMSGSTGAYSTSVQRVGYRPQESLR